MISQNVCFNAWVALLTTLESLWKPAGLLLLNVLEACWNQKLFCFGFPPLRLVLSFHLPIAEPSDCRPFYLRRALFWLGIGRSFNLLSRRCGWAFYVDFRFSPDLRVFRLLSSFKSKPFTMLFSPFRKVLSFRHPIRNPPSVRCM